MVAIWAEESAQKGGLAGAGAARDDDVAALCQELADLPHLRLGHDALADIVLERQAAGAQEADGHMPVVGRGRLDVGDAEIGRDLDRDEGQGRRVGAELDAGEDGGSSSCRLDRPRGEAREVGIAEATSLIAEGKADVLAVDEELAGVGVLVGQGQEGLHALAEGPLGGAARIVRGRVAHTAARQSKAEPVPDERGIAAVLAA